ncbi:MAG: pantoate--beta-alanine ligase [Propionibacteriales bacterium]|nr:pantoate--beta-alanine ligase [Propionibacteriales bacterium]
MTVVPRLPTQPLVVATTRDEVRAALTFADSRPGGERARVALVPTMGALHAGHAALMDAGRERGDVLVASIFVNPLQFGPGDDLDRYPRTRDEDLALCAEHGVDVVFAPSPGVVYPDGEPQVAIDPGPLAGILEGVSRPGHFRGVLTVVAKLFGLVRPDVAVFGQKDYQQLVLIRQMVMDLCLPIEVCGVEIVREVDGLAMSSRNRYLSASERSSALALGRALRAGAAVATKGTEAVVAQALGVLGNEPDVVLDYLAVRGIDLAEPPVMGEARLLIAAKLGATRLIDNAPVLLGLGVRS